MSLVRLIVFAYQASTTKMTTYLRQIMIALLPAKYMRPILTITFMKFTYTIGRPKVDESQLDGDFILSHMRMARLVTGQ